MDIFVVTREGVYRHEIVGAYHDVDAAIEAAKIAAANEPDDYHSFEVAHLNVGMAGEHTVATITRQDEKRIENHRYVIDRTDIQVARGDCSRFCLENEHQYCDQRIGLTSAKCACACHL